MLDQADLADQAARELSEELGISSEAGALKLWVATRGENGSIGLTYLAPALSEADMRAAFADTSAAEQARGREPELDDIAFISPPEELLGLDGPHADYLAPIVRRYADGR
ncbi:hypothetical protein ABT084_11440 [Streptomyces sp. NPDC002138]|uniref:hypothetical protein n=1 Tax=Streptomyces sp. NPDC002138 TaxID=3154410 RepID=UPI00331BF5B4